MEGLFSLSLCGTCVLEKQQLPATLRTTFYELGRMSLHGVACCICSCSYLLRAFCAACVMSYSPLSVSNADCAYMTFCVCKRQAELAEPHLRDVCVCMPLKHRESLMTLRPFLWLRISNHGQRSQAKETAPAFPLHVYHTTVRRRWSPRSLDPIGLPRESSSV